MNGEVDSVSDGDGRIITSSSSSSSSSSRSSSSSSSSGGGERCKIGASTVCDRYCRREVVLWVYTYVCKVA